MAVGLDIAWATPSVSQIQSTGAHFVARYFSPDSSKDITAAEVRDYPANGLSVVVVYESTAQRMLAGHDAGVADAQAAESQRKAVGLPDDMPIYFACDFDAVGGQFSTVNDYMRGVNSVIGLGRSGFYGGYYTVENVAASPATASYFWQASAWSNGHWSGHANIRQDGGTVLSGGADIDDSETDDYGQYPRPTTINPPTNGDDMPISDDDARKIAKAIWEDYQVPIPRLQPDGSTKSDGTQSALWPLVWGNIWSARALNAIASSKLTPAEIAQAVADGTIKVDVNISTTPKGA